MNVTSASMSQMFQSSSSTSNKSSSLSLAQQTLIEETLANYDANSLSESDAQEIVKTFEEAGITPSKELENALSSVGFDAKEIGDLAGVNGNGAASGGRPAGGPPPPPSEDEVSTITDLLESLLNSDDEDDSSTSTSSTSNSVISGTGYDTESSSFDTVLDYTSKMLLLKDDAKDDVMSLIQDYNSDETNLENKQAQTNLLSSLRDVFNKTQNYNTMSFYA